MDGVRIQLRFLSFGESNFTPLQPGEPVFDTATFRFGVGIGGYKAAWYPRATTDGNLQFDNGEGLVSSDANYSLKFTADGIKWNVGATEVLSTRGTNGIAVRSAMMMRNKIGVDTVVVGYAHYIALLAMLFNLKALLRKIVANTATTADVDALLTPVPSVNLATLDPAFPEASGL